MIEDLAAAAWPAVLDDVATDRGAARLEAMVARRAGGEPLQYVLGHWAFRTLDLMVDRRVLIPRPETETVVDVALGEVDRIRAGSGTSRALLAVDLGTGAGGIALSLAAERPGLDVWATDASSAALEVAGANLAGLGGRAAARVRLACGDWWESLPGDLRGQVDVAVSNPPYVTVGEMGGLDAVVAHWEPAGALDGGPDGLDAVRTVVGAAPAWLAAAGALVVEIAPRQAARAVALAEAAGLVGAEVRADLAGRPRVLVARQPRA